MVERAVIKPEASWSLGSIPSSTNENAFTAALTHRKVQLIGFHSLYAWLILCLLDALRSEKLRAFQFPKKKAKTSWSRADCWAR